MRLGRGNAALLGAGNAIVEQLIEVDGEYVEQARELLAAGSRDFDRDDASPAEDDEAYADSAKTYFIGAALSLLWPGLGMAYAGFPLAGFVVAAWSLVALSAAVLDPLGLAVFGGFLPRILDLIGTQYWLRRFGRLGSPVVQQLLIGVGLVTALVLATHYLSVHLYSLIPQQSADWKLHKLLPVRRPKKRASWIRCTTGLPRRARPFSSSRSASSRERCCRNFNKHTRESSSKAGLPNPSCVACLRACSQSFNKTVVEMTRT